MTVARDVTDLDCCNRSLAVQLRAQLSHSLSDMPRLQQLEDLKWREVVASREGKGAEDGDEICVEGGTVKRGSGGKDKRVLITKTFTS